VKLYGLFVLMAGSAVLSPGPGVVMTLGNALRFGVRGSLGGVLGIAAGTIVVATASAAGLGLLLAASPLAFGLLKYCGAAYLAWLGIRLWRTRDLVLKPGATAGAGVQFLEGAALQVVNPNAYLFFFSALPQFIEPAAGRAQQLAALVLTYGALVIAIHAAYAAIAARARPWLASERGQRIVNRAAGASLVGIAAGLLARGL